MQVRRAMGSFGCRMTIVPTLRGPVCLHLVVDLVRSLPLAWQTWLALLIYPVQPCSFLYINHNSPKLKLIFTFIHLQNLLQLGNLETSVIENLRGLIQTDRNENFNICPLTGGCPDGSHKRCDMEKCAIDDKQHLLPPGVDC